MSIPATDAGSYSKTYIRDLTYYEIDPQYDTIYVTAKSPIEVATGLDLTLVYVYMYDENKNFVDQQWSGGRSVTPASFYNDPGLPIPITAGTKYIRLSYGQTAYNGSRLPDIPDPTAYNGTFDVAYVDTRSGS